VSGEKYAARRLTISESAARLETPDVKGISAPAILLAHAGDNSVAPIRERDEIGRSNAALL